MKNSVCTECIWRSKLFPGLQIAEPVHPLLALKPTQALALFADTQPGQWKK